MARTNFSSAEYDFSNMVEEFAPALLAAFQLHQDNILVVEAQQALANFLLHGSGAEDETDILETSNGLYVRVPNRSLWIDGYRITIDELSGYLTVPLEANTTNHVYLDDELVPTILRAKATTNPSGTVYLGTATTDSEVCSAVDDTDADRLLNITTFQTVLNQCVTALGAAYFGATPPEDVDARLEYLETHVGGAAVLWDTLQRTANDLTTISEYVATQIAAHAAEESESGGSTAGDGTVIVPAYYDWPLINMALATLRITEYTDPDYPSALLNFCTIVWGVYGDGTLRDDGTATPDYVDPTSTWIPT